jgi:RNA 3'-terminal phosphate cyclase (ATP)
MASELLTIDGSIGEGGGQVLRTSLALSCILGRPVDMKNIRAGRRKPGLMAQHVTGVRAAAKISRARVTGDEFGSRTLRFEPREIKAGEYEFDVKDVRASAGSVGLVFQTVFVPLAHAGRESRLTLRGGTHVAWAPPANFIANVFLPAAFLFGYRASYHVRAAGFYPKGGGEVECRIMRRKEPAAAVNLEERPETAQVTVQSILSNLPRHIGERETKTARDELRKMGIDPKEQIIEHPSPGEGNAFSILVEFGTHNAGFTVFGERGKRAEQVAREAAEDFRMFWDSGAALDKHLADQLILLMNPGSSFTTCEVTQHLATNIAIVETFLPNRFKLEGEIGRPGKVTAL